MPEMQAMALWCILPVTMQERTWMLLFWCFPIAIPSCYSEMEGLLVKRTGRPILLRPLLFSTKGEALISVLLLAVISKANYGRKEYWTAKWSAPTVWQRPDSPIIWKLI